MNQLDDQFRSPVLKLLSQIADGVSIFEPYPQTPEGWQRFNDTVARLREMEGLGLIGRLFVQTRTSFGEERVEMVMVNGGLTDEGQRLLESNAQASLDHTEP